jgi:hypothetical protein
LASFFGVSRDQMTGAPACSSASSLVASIAATLVAALMLAAF